MKTIYEPVELGNLHLKNRAVRSATFERTVVKDGLIDTSTYKKVYGKLAEGGVGLIITGMIGVGPNACLFNAMAKGYEADFVSKFQEIADEIHRLGSKLVVQLSHCGDKAQGADASDRTLAPSDEELGSGRFAKAMSIEEIKDVVRDFGETALRCKEAGVDGVELHGAHGYLLNQFLSPYHNKRTDEYGGSIENRARLLFEVFDEVRRKVGDTYPVLVKIGCSDLHTPGFTAEESEWVCKELSKRGVDAIELSGGLSLDAQTAAVRGGILKKSQEAYFADAALKLSNEIDTPVISVGGYRSPDIIEEYLNKGNIAAISFCRPLICEPDLINRWKSGDSAKSLCISCNKCFGGKEFGCQQDREVLIKAREQAK